jgi:Cytochrome P450
MRKSNPATQFTKTLGNPILFNGLSLATNSDSCRWLNGDCGTIVVAGSDTTTATLTHVFYHLANSSGVFSKLRKELDSFYKPGSDSEFRDLQEAAYLNGVINEALRLHPPVPGGVLRVTPPEGITIGKTFIPGNVTISTPAYSLGRRGFSLSILPNPRLGRQQRLHCHS